MGYFSSTTTQKTELPEKTLAEQKLDAQMADVLLPAYLDELGYDLKETVNTVYDNPALVTQLEGQLNEKNSRITELEASGTGAIGTFEAQSGMGSPDAKELHQLKIERDRLMTQLDTEKESAKTEVGYDYELNERGQALEVERGKQLGREAEASEMFFNTYKKFASGDYSITDSQKQLIEDQLGAIRDPVTAMLNEVSAEYERTGTSMGAALDNYMGEIKKTGLSVEAALSAVEDRIKNTNEGVMAGISEEEKRLADTGQSVFAALKGVGVEIANTGDETRAVLEDTFKMKSMLVEKNMRDTYEKQRQATATKAASIGRSPMDPRFQIEMMTALNEQIDFAQLKMSVEESSALAGLTERTGQRQEVLKQQEAQFTETQGRRSEEEARLRTQADESAGLRQEQAAGERAALAERTGQRQEGVMGQRVGVAERTGAGKEAVAGQKASLEESTQKYGADLRQQYGVGIPASQIGLGMDVAGYGQAVRQQGLANAQGAIGTVGGVAGTMQQERMAQPTKTTTDSGSVFGTIMGTLGGLAGAAGGVAGGIGGLKR